MAEAHQHFSRSEQAAVGRRAFLLAGGAIALAGAAGCQPRTAARGVPAGGWPSTPLGMPPDPAVPVETAAATAPAATPFPNVIERGAWARGTPEPALMDPMVPVHSVTIHHDGMDDLFQSRDAVACAARIERYRRGHRERGWGDIGYHFVIDPAGRVWQGRPLEWQGAHVKDHNPGNVGILVMGNFEIQRPTEAQLVTLEKHLAATMAYWNVPWTRAYSHREWPSARTLCPGRNLQERFAALRGTGFARA